ncbi:hypothetical protein ACGFU5_46420, partial [Streptomyces sp. NPDC048527]
MAWTVDDSVSDVTWAEWVEGLKHDRERLAKPDGPVVLMFTRLEPWNGAFAQFVADSLGVTVYYGHVRLPLNRPLTQIPTVREGYQQVEPRGVPVGWSPPSDAALWDRPRLREGLGALQALRAGAGDDRGLTWAGVRAVVSAYYEVWGGEMPVFGVALDAVLAAAVAAVEAGQSWGDFLPVDPSRPLAAVPVGGRVTDEAVIRAAAAGQTPPALEAQPPQLLQPDQLPALPPPTFTDIDFTTDDVGLFVDDLPKLPQTDGGLHVEAPSGAAGAGGPVVPEGGAALGAALAVGAGAGGLLGVRAEAGWWAARAAAKAERVRRVRVDPRKKTVLPGTKKSMKHVTDFLLRRFTYDGVRYADAETRFAFVDGQEVLEEVWGRGLARVEREVNAQRFVLETGGEGEVFTLTGVRVPFEGPREYLGARAEEERLEREGVVAVRFIARPDGYQMSPWRWYRDASAKEVLHEMSHRVGMPEEYDEWGARPKEPVVLDVPGSAMGTFDDPVPVPAPEDVEKSAGTLEEWRELRDAGWRRRQVQLMTAIVASQGEGQGQYVRQYVRTDAGEYARWIRRVADEMGQPRHVPEAVLGPPTPQAGQPAVVAEPANLPVNAPANPPAAPPANAPAAAQRAELTVAGPANLPVNAPAEVPWAQPNPTGRPKPLPAQVVRRWAAGERPPPALRPPRPHRPPRAVASAAFNNLFTSLVGTTDQGARSTAAAEVLGLADTEEIPWPELFYVVEAASRAGSVGSLADLKTYARRESLLVWAYPEFRHADEEVTSTYMQVLSLLEDWRRREDGGRDLTTEYLLDLVRAHTPEWGASDMDFGEGLRMVLEEVARQWKAETRSGLGIELRLAGLDAGSDAVEQDRAVMPALFKAAGTTGLSQRGIRVLQTLFGGRSVLTQEEYRQLVGGVDALERLVGGDPLAVVGGVTPIDEVARVVLNLSIGEPVDLPMRQLLIEWLGEAAGAGRAESQAAAAAYYLETSEKMLGEHTRIRPGGTAFVGRNTASSQRFALDMSAITTTVEGVGRKRAVNKPASWSEHAYPARQAIDPKDGHLVWRRSKVKSGIHEVPLAVGAELLKHDPERIAPYHEELVLLFPRDTDWDGVYARLAADIPSLPVSYVKAALTASSRRADGADPIHPAIPLGVYTRRVEPRTAPAGKEPSVEAVWGREALTAGLKALRELRAGAGDVRGLTWAGVRAVVSAYYEVRGGEMPAFG